MDILKHNGNILRYNGAPIYWESGGGPVFPTTGLQSYWRMDENTGTTVSDAYGSVHGTLSNGTWVAGKKNYGLEDGSGFTIDLGTAYRYNITDAWSFSCWYKASSATDYLFFFCNAKNGHPYNGVQITRENGYFQIDQISNYSTNRMRKTSVSTYGDTTSWNNFITTFSGAGNAAGVKMYYNGSLINAASSQDNCGTITFENKTAIGNRFGATGLYNGLIDECAIWNREITSTEVATIYNGGTGIFY